MAGFSKTREVVDAEVVDGNYHYTIWRKVPTQTTITGNWFDLSMTPGNPSPQYYAASPLIANSMAKSTDGGINHGGNVSPYKKYLRKTLNLTKVVGPTPINMVLCDYLLYYPFIDESTIDEQLLDNTVTLPRYTDGDGVQVMAVVVASHATGGMGFTINYTNSEGVSGRVSNRMVLTTNGTFNGTVITSGRTSAAGGGAFVSLQNGDTGVRSIESVTMDGTDVGLFSLVLVKPIAQGAITGIDAAVEKDYLINHSQAPEIKDDAYLNWIVCPNGNLSSGGNSLLGEIYFVWK